LIGLAVLREVAPTDSTASVDPPSRFLTILSFSDNDIGLALISSFGLSNFQQKERSACNAPKARKEEEEKEEDEGFIVHDEVMSERRRGGNES
jgi:hypothetical protein